LHRVTYARAAGDCYPNRCGNGWPWHIWDRSGADAIPYAFDSTVPSRSRDVVRNAISILEDTTCITFTEVPASYIAKPKVLVVIDESSPGCWASPAGYPLSVGAQESRINLQACRESYNLGNVLHEFNHVLGVAHEHKRADRGQYIQIKWQNIEDDWVAQYTVDGQTHQGEAYDYGSIMHYPAGDAIDTLPGGTHNGRLGQRNHMSKADVRQLRDMYACDREGTVSCSDRSDQLATLFQNDEYTCPQFAANGWCNHQTYKNTIQFLCQVSCGMCPSPATQLKLPSGPDQTDGHPTCKEVEQECPSGALTGREQWMLKRCPETCRKMAAPAAVPADADVMSSVDPKTEESGTERGGASAGDPESAVMAALGGASAVICLGLVMPRQKREVGEDGERRTRAVTLEENEGEGLIQSHHQRVKSLMQGTVADEVKRAHRCFNIILCVGTLVIVSLVAALVLGRFRASRRVQGFHPMYAEELFVDMGCFPLLGEDLTDDSSVDLYDTECATSEDATCRSGLPFYRLAFHKDGEPFVYKSTCARFCLSKGFDISGVVRGKECRCGTSAENLANWDASGTGPHTRAGLKWQDEANRKTDTSSPECKITATRYVGPLKLSPTGEARKLDLQHFNEQDFAYVKTILTQSRTFLTADDLGSRSAPLVEGRDIGPAPGNAVEGRSCYPRRCGRGWPWPLWPTKDGVRGAAQGIPFAFDAAVRDDTKLLFRLVLDDVQKETCLKFMEVPVEDKAPKIKVTEEGPTCAASSLGFADADTELNLGGCNTLRLKGRVLRELTHVLGMGWEETRLDRGTWVEVPEGQYHQNANEYIGSAATGRAPYDYDSITHSSSMVLHGKEAIALKTLPASGVSGWRDQIIGMHDCQVGQREGLSKGDIAQLRDMYGCDQEEIPCVDLVGTGSLAISLADGSLQNATCASWASRCDDEVHGAVIRYYCAASCKACPKKLWGKKKVKGGDEANVLGFDFTVRNEGFDLCKDDDKGKVSAMIDAEMSWLTAANVTEVLITPGDCSTGPSYQGVAKVSIVGDIPLFTVAELNGEFKERGMVDLMVESFWMGEQVPSKLYKIVQTHRFIYVVEGVAAFALTTSVLMCCVLQWLRTEWEVVIEDE
jgi:hypothetical protein